MVNYIALFLNDCFIGASENGTKISEIKMETLDKLRIRLWSAF